MADNSTLPATGDAIRDVQKGGAAGPKTQVMVLDRGGAGAEDLSPIDGTDITTPTAMPTGGVGIRGWLSAIWTKLNGFLSVIVTSNGVVSTVNSSAVALGIGGTFTGAAEDVTEYADIRVSVFTDQLSATDGLQIQQSSNGTNWDVSDAYNIPIGVGKVFSVGVSARFLRIVYTNGATAQAAFRLQVKLHKGHSRPSSVRPQDGRTNDNDMDEMLGHLMGYNGTSWDRLRASIANGLAVDVTRAPPAVASTANVSTSTVLQNAATVTGVGASMTVTGYGTSVLRVSGVFVGSIAFKASQDAGANWDPISATQVGGGDIFTVATLPGNYRLTVAGMDLIRAEVTLTSGTITITGKSTNATNASKIVKLATSGLTIGALVANQSVNKAQINGVVPLMGNGVSGTGSQRVNIASDNAAIAVNATLAAETIKVIGTVNLAAAQTLAVVTTVAAVTAITNPFPAGTNSIGTTPGPALIKGTQGAVGHSTQDLKDAGRVAISFTTEFSPGAVAEAMLSMNVSKDGATTAAFTSYPVTSGKRLRITSISHFVENTLGTSIQRAYLRMRFAATGGALITSPLQMSIPVAAAGAVKSISSTFEDIPDGLEFLGDGTKAIGFSLQAPDWVTAAATLKVYVTVVGFEY